MGSPNPEYQFGLAIPPSSIANIKRTVLNAAATLTTAQSGALCVWGSATGFTYTLPAITADTVGTWFEFYVQTTNTATACKIITDAASTFIKGEVITFVDNTTPSATAGPKGFSFNGSTHVACTMGGADTTTGGVAGTRVFLTAYSSTQWLIAGTIIGAGTIATPAATS